ncbi:MULTISPECIES: 50S ribosomal protein L7/L12 [Mycoplasmopsis]|uniref:Large ribosomal subunit protein bL12 n=8 Tax=Bacteria TaxID=2 RepID=RL7_MYCAP|nr:MULTISPECIES: 50S ribosomal protein L7/L12 [Mycoplasmopsis]A5IZ59.1 RecName: Full=Large ribosomal subunit protein bL12; AltName: Full=50S ribosomal protein L7/L12 [Mycoplasmopsis agalactiae PG2]TKA59515.1 50S ribosomal protein L7/L12 [Mycoplasmopsis bovis 8790]ADR24715.1 ribosomal protein L7/L12 [Mycoplasmopsis bovis PG45]AEI90370.1 50S ribosomal protein L7/L12 [Mycoplasmopsis bovis Hubei-1]AFM52046.1 50S ribosomal protein [Mycoplasmopsis bovis HB0801]AIA34227.1 50S ribosomal protein L7/L1
MAKLTKESFISSLKEMSIKEVMELVEAMKEEFGIDPSAVAVAAAAPAAEAEEKKSTLSVILKSDNGKKLAIVKAVKELLNLALMDANKLVSTLPATLKENIPAAEAEALKAKLVEAGADVELK